MAISNFLDVYLNKYKLTDVSSVVQKHIEELEKSLHDMYLTAPDSKKFDDVAKAHVVDLVDLTERVKQHLSKWHFSWTNVWGSLKFVLNISNEVSQIVNSLYTETAGKDYSTAKQLAFGQDLVWFVWSTINPLKDKYTWIPFKKTIEHKVVRNVAKIGLQAAFDILDVNKPEAKAVAKIMSTGTTSTVNKCLRPLVVT